MNEPCYPTFRGALGKVCLVLVMSLVVATSWSMAAGPTFVDLLTERGAVVATTDDPEELSLAAWVEAYAAIHRYARRALPRWHGAGQTVPHQAMRYEDPVVIVDDQTVCGFHGFYVHTTSRAFYAMVPTVPGLYRVAFPELTELSLTVRVEDDALYRVALGDVCQARDGEAASGLPAPGATVMATPFEVGPALTALEPALLELMERLPAAYIIHVRTTNLRLLGSHRQGNGRRSDGADEDYHWPSIAAYREALGLVLATGDEDLAQAADEAYARMSKANRRLERERETVVALCRGESARHQQRVEELFLRYRSWYRRIRHRRLAAAEEGSA